MKRSPPGILPLVPIQRRSTRPLHRQLYEGYREAIIAGRLRAGQRLPSTRALARELGISRIPVLGAFDQLLAEGYVEARVGAGTFVARVLPESEVAPLRAGRRARARQPSRTLARDLGTAGAGIEPWSGGTGAFRVSEPALDEFPFRLWSALVSRHARQGSSASFGYAGPLGFAPLREAVAAYLRTSRAVRCEADQIMIVSGSQQALSLCARVLLDTASPVWLEEPGYPGARDAFALRGATIVPVPIDAEGLDIAAGISCCAGARAVYVTPSHQYPLGVTMSAARRLHLLDWAEREGAWIIEDDYDSEYRYESPPIGALQGLDHDGRVIYIGTFSKVLFPALRLGYLVLPPDLVSRFARVREAMDIFPPVLPQAALADFIGEGHFARHLRRMRVLYRERRSALVSALARVLGPRVSVLGAEAGMHLVALLGKARNDREIAERAARVGLWVTPLSSCYIGAPPAPGLVLGFGGTRAERMAKAVLRLGGVIERG